MQVCKFWSPHSGDHEISRLMEYGTVAIGKQFPKFRIRFPFWTAQVLKMEVASFSETSVTSLIDMAPYPRRLESSRLLPVKQDIKFQTTFSWDYIAVRMVIMSLSALQNSSRDGQHKVVLLWRHAVWYTVKQETSGIKIRKFESFATVLHSCIHGVSLSSIHYSHSCRKYINQRHQYVCLIWI